MEAFRSASRPVLLPLIDKSSRKILLRSLAHLLLVFILDYGLPTFQRIALAQPAQEYQVKTAFIYNFLAFTQWPANGTQVINLCLYGEDHFGQEIDKLQNKSIGTSSIKVLRINDPDQLQQCQAVFFSKAVNNNLAGILSSLSDKPVLTLADHSNAISKGAIINLNLIHEKIVFEINLGAARKTGLDISSKLLQLAAKVHQ